MRFLFTTFEGGGHVPPAIRVARLLQSRGHQVLFVSDEANRAQADAAGLTFTTWRTAPNRHALGQADDPLDEWRRKWPPAIVRAVCDAVICGPAAAYAADTLAMIGELRPDAVVSNELLFGCMMAAEKAGAPLALLTSNVWCFPTREDVPPFGPGFLPGAGMFQQGRERTTRRLIAGWYDAGLADLNAARAAHDLEPLKRTLDQLGRADLILLGASRAFDYDVAAPPSPFVYAGPLGDAPSWVDDGAVDDLIDPQRPNVLVSFSTTYQAQDRVVARCIRALAELPVRGIVTLGPALDPAALPSAGNVRVVASASHDRLIPHCAAMICHAGHGTMIRPLMHGVPVVCLPTGRDQPENAARIAWAGAGLRLSPAASAGAIRKATARLLAEPAFRDSAARLGDRLRVETDGGVTAAERLEALAGRQ